MLKCCLPCFRLLRFGPKYFLHENDDVSAKSSYLVNYNLMVRFSKIHIQLATTATTTKQLTHTSPLSSQFLAWQANVDQKEKKKRKKSFVLLFAAHFFCQMLNKDRCMLKEKQHLSHTSLSSTLDAS